MRKGMRGGLFDLLWFYLGDPRQTEERLELRRLLAERQAIVLCGHQHVLSLKDAVWPEGRITEFTMNTVFYGHGLRENPAVPDIVYDDPALFGSLSGENEWWKGDAARIHAEYRPFLRRCYHAHGVRHAVLRVSDGGVAIDYYGHAARMPTALSLTAGVLVSLLTPRDTTSDADRTAAVLSANLEKWKWEKKMY